MTYDPAWDMPKDNWQQQGSFEVPQVPPVVDPDAGTQVCIGPIAFEWVPFILGALDQLRNPSTWRVADDNAMYDTLNRVTRLRQIVSLAGPCMTYQLRMTDTCELQSSVDGGATWATVTGWVPNFANCVSNVIIPPNPPNPGGNTPAQQACNIAGYISNEIIKLAITNAVNAYNSSLSLLQFGVLVFDTIAFAFPITAIAIDVLYALYLEVNAGTIGDFTDAETDPALWNAVTCAIYAAISVDGKITTGNLPTVIANVCGITYVHADVVTALCNFITGIGIQNLRAMQNVGVIDVLDCSHCGGAGWCFNTPFNSTTMGPWQYFNPVNQSGHWVAHQGVVADNFFSGNYYSTVKIYRTSGRIGTIYASWAAPFGVVASQTFVQVLLAGALVIQVALVNGVSLDLSAYTGDELVVQVAGGAHSVTLLRVQLSDTVGSNPFGPNNC